MRLSQTGLRAAEPAVRELDPLTLAFARAMLRDGMPKAAAGVIAEARRFEARSIPRRSKPRRMLIAALAATLSMIAASSTLSAVPETTPGIRGLRPEATSPQRAATAAGSDSAAGRSAAAALPGGAFGGVAAPAPGDPLAPTAPDGPSFTDLLRHVSVIESRVPRQAAPIMDQVSTTLETGASRADDSPLRTFAPRSPDLSAH